MRRRRLFVLLSLLPFSLTGSFPARAADVGTVAARWSGGEVTVDQVRGCVEARRKDPSRAGQATAEGCLEDLVRGAVLPARAKKIGLAGDRTLLWKRQKFLERILSGEVQRGLAAAVPPPGDEEVEEFLQEGRFYDFSWARFSGLPEAEAALGEAAAGRAFHDLGGSSGRVAGYGRELEMESGLLRSVRKVGLRQVGGPFESGGGYWVVKVHGYRLPAIHGGAEGAARSTLAGRGTAKALAALVEQLRERAEIRIDEAAISVLAADEDFWARGDKTVVQLGEVNGRPLLLDGFDHAELRHGIDTHRENLAFRAMGLRRKADQGVVWMLVAEEGERRGLLERKGLRDRLRREEDKLLMEALLDGEFRKIVVPAEEVRAYYDLHREDFSVQGWVHYTGLLFEERAAAETFTREAAASPSLDEAMARALAGERVLGQLNPGKMTYRNIPGYLRELVLGSPVGEVRILAHEEAWQAVAVLSRTPPAARPLEEVSFGIENRLRREEWQSRGLPRFLEETLRKAQVVKFPEALQDF